MEDELNDYLIDLSPKQLRILLEQLSQDVQANTASNLALLQERQQQRVMLEGLFKDAPGLGMSLDEVRGLHVDAVRAAGRDD